jgi:HEAT repeat protein
VDDDVTTINKLSFRIPILFDRGRRAQVEQLRLYVSTDRGKTWKQAGSITPDEEYFTYTAPDDGLYWFAVQVVTKNKEILPATVTAEAVSQKVLVDTRPVTRVTAKAGSVDETVKEHAGPGTDTRPASKLLSQIVPALVEALGDSEGDVRQTAFETLKFLGKDSVPSLREALQSKNVAVRANASYVLAWQAELAQDALPALGRLLKDQSPEVRRRAIYAIYWIADAGKKTSRPDLPPAHPVAVSSQPAAAPVAVAQLPNPGLLLPPPKKSVTDIWNELWKTTTTPIGPATSQSFPPYIRPVT